MQSDSGAVNILLVDDEPKNLVALESVLTSDDWNLVPATSGQEALKHLLEDDFAVILLDVHMPNMDGFETAELIRNRERSRDIPIIFLTAAIRGETYVSRGYSLGAVDYILKPFDPDILRSKVSVLVDLFRKTEQVKQQAAELSETTALLNSVLDSATEYAITAMDLDGGFLAWNEGARRLYGYTADEVIGKQNMRALHTPEDVTAGRVDQFMKTAARTGKAEGEFERVRKNGRRFSASLTIDRRKDASGAHVGYVSIARDITALKRAEQERGQLIESQAARAAAEAARDRLQQVVDVLPEGIALADAEGQVYLSNAAAEEIVGQTPLGTSITSPTSRGVSALDGTHSPPEELPLARAVQRGEVVRGEQILIPHAATGRQVPLLVNAAPLRDSDGAIVGGVVAFQDITTIKELERQKDSFLAAASHDLKNPLAAIKARAQLLQRRAARVETDDGAALVDGLRGIDKAATRLSGMINQLLDVTQLQMGRRLDLDRHSMDLVELARQVAADLQPATEQHQVRVVYEQPCLVGEWDQDRLERVLSNLVSNAIKYSPDGGDVIVELKRDRQNGCDWAVVQVCDRGVGIPIEDLPQVFERFYRGSNVTGKIEGTGIGLSGVRQIVEQHGGEVSVESEERVGSTFTVRLPLGTPTD